LGAGEGNQKEARRKKGLSLNWTGEKGILTHLVEAKVMTQCQETNVWSEHIQGRSWVCEGRGPDQKKEEVHAKKREGLAIVLQGYTKKKKMENRMVKRA